MKTQMNPYLNFPGNCREAMSFYRECLGGELLIQKVSESPAMAARMSPEMGDKVLHAELKYENVVIMASDMHHDKPIDGNTVHLCINCKSEDELNTFFNSLAEGGKIMDPLLDMPWGARYGSLTDKFGKHWLFNFDRNQS